MEPIRSESAERMNEIEPSSIVVGPASARRDKRVVMSRSPLVCPGDTVVARRDVPARRGAAAA
ncbi:Uncharacterised protein [Mycobacteroides abscessus subsp. abscessus]|nr:Uncharacterised protein [Mycobacteroides abscessus subsp. abscessus]